MIQPTTYCLPAFLSAGGGAALASLLPEACPNISKLGVGGWIGEEALATIGLHIPKLRHLQMLNEGDFFFIANQPFDTLLLTGGVHQGPLLPNLTHLDKERTKVETVHLRRICQLLFCPSLTH